MLCMSIFLCALCEQCLLNSEEHWNSLLALSKRLLHKLAYSPLCWEEEIIAGRGGGIHMQPSQKCDPRKAHRLCLTKDKDWVASDTFKDIHISFRHINPKRCTGGIRICDFLICSQMLWINDHHPPFIPPVPPSAVPQRRAWLWQRGDGHEAFFQGCGTCLPEEPGGRALRDGQHLPTDVSHPGDKSWGQRWAPRQHQTHVGLRDPGWVCFPSVSFSAYCFYLSIHLSISMHLSI